MTLQQYISSDLHNMTAKHEKPPLRGTLLSLQISNFRITKKCLSLPHVTPEEYHHSDKYTNIATQISPLDKQQSIKVTLLPQTLCKRKAPTLRSCYSTSHPLTYPGPTPNFSYILVAVLAMLQMFVFDRAG